MGESRDAEYMRQAIAMARAGIAAGQTPFGACVVCGDRVVACAHNGVWARTDITAHAEILAIREACRALGTVHLAGCAIYTTCEPCPMCFAACHWARLDRICYGAGIADAREAGFRELAISAARMRALGGSPVHLAGGVLREEARALFAEWQARGLSDPY